MEILPPFYEDANMIFAKSRPLKVDTMLLIWGSQILLRTRSHLSESHDVLRNLYLVVVLDYYGST